MVPPPLPHPTGRSFGLCKDKPSLFQAPQGGSRRFPEPKQQRVGFLAFGDPCAILAGLRERYSTEAA